MDESKQLNVLYTSNKNNLLLINLLTKTHLLLLKIVLEDYSFIWKNNLFYLNFFHEGLLEFFSFYPFIDLISSWSFPLVLSMFFFQKIT